MGVVSPPTWNDTGPSLGLRPVTRPPSLELCPEASLWEKERREERRGKGGGGGGEGRERWERQGGGGREGRYIGEN